MVMQEAKPDTPEASATERPHSRKLMALIASGAVVVMVAAIVVYFVAFRSLPTTVSWAPSVSAVSPGGEVTVAGRITPADSGRQVLIEGASSSRGPWQPMAQAATTDSRGRFTITFKPAIETSMVMRVVVDPAGRYLEVTGRSMPVRLLSLSSINLSGGGLVTNQIPVNFTVTVDPPSIGRTVKVEQSSDKVHWTAVGRRDRPRPAEEQSSRFRASRLVSGPTVQQSHRMTSSPRLQAHWPMPQLRTSR